MGWFSNVFANFDFDRLNNGKKQNKAYPFLDSNSLILWNINL